MSTMFTQVFHREIAETEARVRSEVKTEDQIIINALQNENEVLKRRIAELESSK